MSKNKKKLKKRKSIKKNIGLKKELNTKKILNGVDLTSEHLKEKNDRKNLEINKFNINDHIQTFVSILLTIIIIIALVILGFVIYNNYLKKDDNSSCDVDEVCKDFIKKDYNIEEVDVLEFLKNTRGIIYNIDNFNIDKITNDDYLNFATYFIWNSSLDYQVCNNDIDPICLVTKKELDFNALKEYFKKYLNISEVNIIFDTEFGNEEIRIYKNQDKVILTFGEFEYQTAKHDVIDVNIDEDKIKVIFALTNKNTDETYSYVGYKKVSLKYVDEKFIIEKIETSLN